MTSDVLQTDTSEAPSTCNELRLASSKYIESLTAKEWDRGTFWSLNFHVSLILLWLKMFTLPAGFHRRGYHKSLREKHMAAQFKEIQ